MYKELTKDTILTMIGARQVGKTTLLQKEKKDSAHSKIKDDVETVSAGAILYDAFSDGDSDDDDFDFLFWKYFLKGTP